MILCSTLHPSQLQCALRFTLFSPLHHLPFSLHGLLILKPTNRTLIFFIQCSVFLLESFSIFCIQYHFLNSMQYFSFENFLCFASNFSAMYNHNRRLVLAKKLLSYNNKNIIYCILTTVHVLFVWFVASMRKVRWCHQVLSFYVLPFATTQVCPALFQKPQLLFLPSRPFSTRLATALCSRLLQEAGLDPFHISSRPLRISENYKMSDCSEDVWGESAQETLFQTFLEKSRKGVLL